MRLPWCFVLGHDWFSFSIPVEVRAFPEVKRVRKRWCCRCGYTEYAINQL